VIVSYAIPLTILAGTATITVLDVPIKGTFRGVIVKSPDKTNQTVDLDIIDKNSGYVFSRDSL